MELSSVPSMHMLWSYDEVQTAIRQVAKSVNDLYSYSDAVNLVPVLTGAMPFCSDLAMELERLSPGKWCIAPVFVTTYLDDGLVREPMVEFPSKFNDSIDADSPVVIIDDLLDTGTTMAHLVNEFKRGGFAEVSVCVLVDKPSARKNDVSPDFCALVSDSEAWLVGYGMDTQKRYRALDGVYVLELPPEFPDQKQLDFPID